MCDQPSAGDVGLEFSSGTKGEHIGAKPNVARGQCQHVPLLCPTGDEARIIPERSKRATPSVPTSIPAGIADWFSIEQYRDACPS
jgi:hypothetical protein